MTPSLNPTPGTTLFIRNEYNAEHLTVVLTSPDHDNCVVLASVTTDRQTPLTDSACFLTEGDHPFLDGRQSFVLYAKAEARPVGDLQYGLDQDVIRLGLPFGASVLERIIDGALVSPRTPRIVRDAVKRQHSDRWDATAARRGAAPTTN